jgi:hypothetical protein
MVPGTDWDVADVWYATSQDGFTWKEQGPAVRRPAKPTRGFRSICTPDVLVWKGKYYLYFQAYSPKVGGQQYCPVMAAVAEWPDGPWAFVEKSGLAALVALDGPEKNTIQYAADGENFEIMSILQVPSIAPGLFIPDAFADMGDGRGFIWGLCHINPDGGGATNESTLARFDCDLSLDVDRPLFKRNNLQFEASTYFQPRVRLPENLRRLIKRERVQVDRDTILIP